MLTGRDPRPGVVPARRGGDRLVGHARHAGDLLAAARARASGDALAVGVLLAMVAAVAWEGFRADWALYRLDIVGQFLPFFAHLGERLRAGDVPGWTPHQFAGAPFAGDPLSGWTYLPAMLPFALLPPVAAYELFVVFHLALAALAAYALGRVLGLGAPAAAVAGAAFACGPLVEHTRCCTVYSLVPVWVPVALLGVELALRDGPPLRRAAWLGVAAFAASQMLAAWLGQGAYYGLLVVGGWLAYRTLLDPPTPRPLRARLGLLVLGGAALLAVAFGLAAAGVLPRLDANARSTLAGGVYRGAAAYAAGSGGWWPGRAAGALVDYGLQRGRWYAGGAALTLALLAVPLARRRHAVPFFALVGVLALLLALDGSPLERPFALLPRFWRLHQHIPERVMVLFYLAQAMLAGAAVQALTRPSPRPVLRRFVPFAPPLVLAPLALLAGRHGYEVRPSTLAAALAVVLLAGLAVWGAPAPRRAGLGPVLRLVPVALLLLVWWDPSGRRLAEGVADPLGDGGRVAVAAYTETDPGGAAAFLRDRAAAAPVRYFGYDAALLALDGPRLGGYFRHFSQPASLDLLLVNRATTVGLDDVQGYNPAQPARWAELVRAMNGAGQEYHETSVYPAGLASPLLDLLNARYAVVPAALPPGRPDLLHLGQRWPTAWRDRRVRVLENPEALPRAWIVHAAAGVEPGGALPLLASGAVDPRRTALLEAPPPRLAPAAHPAADRAEFVTYGPDRIVLATRSDAPGLLVLAESHDPGWRAYVDGRRVPLYVADHALRAVPLPAGEHAVELRYEPPALRLGLGITLATALGVGFLWVAAWARPVLGRAGRVAGFGRGQGRLAA